MRALAFILATFLSAQAAEPVTSAWILSKPTDNANLRRQLPEVHEVAIKDAYVEINSAGLSLYYMGPFQDPPEANTGLRDLHVRIPRRPIVEEDASKQQRVGPGQIGIFLNGVPLYNICAESSYEGRNIWHFDPIASRQSSLGVLESIIATRAQHSPLLGFANDGFPIYGPYAPTRMHSGYRLRKIHDRTTLPGGTKLTPSQYGPPVHSEYPLGTFAEDYEYRPATGDLDEHNGRFAITPEYRNGTYAYFLTTTDDDRLAFPYFLAASYKGKLEEQPTERESIETGKPTELKFKLPSPLEIVHEKPVHLIVVSSDRKVFQHIHPEWKQGDWYTVTHTFTQPGKYKLYAQYTPAGQPEQLKTYELEVKGDPKPTRRPKSNLTVHLNQPGKVETGKDIPFRVEIEGDAIEPYLGAWAHFVLIDETLSQFIHAHPQELGAPTAHTHIPTGPPPNKIDFTTNFAKPGNYKLWAQFQVDGQPIAIPFNVEVEPAVTTPTAQQRIPKGAIEIQIDSQGFKPSRIEAQPNKPLTLAIKRTSAPNCAGQIVFPTLRIKHDLPIGQTTILQLPPLTQDLTFTCGMGMYRGMIVAQELEQPRD